MVDKARDRVNVSKVIDAKGSVRTGREAVSVWRKHFDEVLNGGDMAKEVGRREAKVGDGGGDVLGGAFTREEVIWALIKLKVKAAAGKDGLTVEMINREMLVDMWWELCKGYWLNGMVPSVWKSSVPKKKTIGDLVEQMSLEEYLWCQWCIYMRQCT